MNLFLATKPFTGFLYAGKLVNLKTYAVELRNTIWLFIIYYLTLAPPIK